MSVFTDAEIEFLGSQRLARIATASATGLPDVSPVTFGLDDDCLVSGGFDITKTVRYKHLLANPRATMVVDELQSIDPWRPRGLKVRGAASLEDDGSGKLSVRIRPAVIWSWGINSTAVANPGAIEKRVVGA
jgi:pyridoxamine 5'-phosphate oxidase family protein